MFRSICSFVLFDFKLLKLDRLFLLPLITWVLFSFGCDNENYHQAHFIVINNTNHEIDSLFISNKKFDIGRNNKTYILTPNKPIRIEVDMTNTKVDGSYSIHYKINGKRYFENFGYYTNGFPLEELTRIQIVNSDSLVIEYE